MNFIISHWHCILPIGGILIAFFIMREKPNKNNKNIENIEKSNNT